MYMQYPVTIEMFVLLAEMVLAMDVLKYVSQVFGEQFAVMLSGIILMLVSYARS